MFKPLEIKIDAKTVSKVEIQDDGLSMTLPSILGGSGLKMKYRDQGRTLFDLKSKELIERVLHLVQISESSRQAYERGVSEERQRMAQDLHDDLGAKLLTGLHQSDERLKPILQSAISDLRSIVKGVSGEQVLLSRLLADLRYETSQRLLSVSIELDWPIMPLISDRKLNYRERKALESGVREVVSNLIRHSQAKFLSVKPHDLEDSFVLEMTNDGLSFETHPEIEGSGFGLKSIKRRFEDIHGNFEISEANPGVSFKLALNFK